MSSQKLGAFLTWAEKSEIVWDKTAIEVREGKHGLGIFAKKNLDAGIDLVKVPKSLVLSVESTAIANLLEEEGIEGYVGLTLGAMYELSCSDGSPWSAYLDLLTSRPPQMATSLTLKQREKMKSCEAYQDVENDIADLKDDYESIVVPFLERNLDIFTEETRQKYFNFESFKIMTEIVSSRAMDVDHFHISALVPFADFVNHSPMPNGDYVTYEEVCEVCGAVACEHMNESDNEDEDNEDQAPELADPSNPKETTADDSDENNNFDQEGDEEWEDEDEDEDEEETEEELKDTCDIILDMDLKRGSEILRHYGPFPNKILLGKYGFAVVDNPHDTVTIQLEMVREAADKLTGNKDRVEERIQWFLSTEDAFLGSDDGSGEGDGCGDGCCDGEDHDHDHGHGHGEKHGLGGNDKESGHGHKHADDGSCCSVPNNAKKLKKAHADEGSDKDENEEDEEDEDEEEDEEEEEADDFPRDLMYLLQDGTVDDRLFLLLNVIFMEQSQFEKVKEDLDVAIEYFDEIFKRRREEEQDSEDEDEDEDSAEEGSDSDESGSDVEFDEHGKKIKGKPAKEEPLPPRDKKSKKVRKAVLEGILAVIRLRASAFGVTAKTTAEHDLEALNKAKLSGPLYYAQVCVQGEKQILQNSLQGYGQFLSEL
ncbi:hypothetical protein BGW38_001501 [Lunasporangiospora selenospora]|uniref:SET domain-containing protein n=1 Tax=Lunasporangiospora selenospora TaxID=979761 RepID=A0A9P6FU86_9FUNG|nr:hypothetical protein BGW38_001501 [Lunasporangiospora selenospora]